MPVARRTKSRTSRTKGRSTMTKKASSAAKKSNPWLKAVAQTRKNYPRMSLKEAMIATKRTYRRKPCM